MNKKRPSGADMDPVPAYVYLPGEGEQTSGEKGPAEPVKVLGPTRIKSPTGLFVIERTQQDHANSQVDQYIDIRSAGGGDRLSAPMFIYHRNVRYDIKGSMGVDWRQGTTRYQVSCTYDYRLPGNSPDS